MCMPMRRFFYFSTGFFFCSMLLNITLLYFPILGIPKSSIGAWLADWGGWGRPLALLAGTICGLGNTCAPLSYPLQA